MKNQWTFFILTVLAVIAPRATVIAQGVIPPGSSPSDASASAPSVFSPPRVLRDGAAPATQPQPVVTDTKVFGPLDLPGPAPEPHPNRFLLEASWDNGLHLESDNQQFNVHVGGVGQVDTVFLIGPQSEFALKGGGANGVGNAEATLLRRAVLQADGTFWDQFDFFIQFDFANASNENDTLQPPSFGTLTTSPAPLNVWMQIHDLPYLGSVRAGNQKKTIGMDNNTSMTFLPFMERADNMDAFYGGFDNGFAMGIAAQNWTESERLTWRYGVFQPATNSFGITLNKYEIGARLTALPWYADDGARLIHVGLGYLGGELVQDELRDRARTILRNAPGFAVPVLVDTSEVPGSKQYTIAPEFAMVLGSLTIQAEYAAQFLIDAIAPDGVNQGTVFYHGGYVETLYFLTGEHQNYDRREGVFGRVIPRSNLHLTKRDGCTGCGAWQIGVRFSFVDLNDKAIQGGQLYDITAGLNWFLNPNMKVQCNYIAEHRDMPGVPIGWINGVGLRAAYDF
jgi:phosphate-selective porin OprO/OprP